LGFPITSTNSTATWKSALTATGAAAVKASEVYKYVTLTAKADAIIYDVKIAGTAEDIKSTIYLWDYNIRLVTINENITVDSVEQIGLDRIKEAELNADTSLSTAISISVSAIDAIKNTQP
jgi:translation initiation factor 2 alpha subunit (eIF-2alpha)